MSYKFPETVKTFGEAVRHLRNARGLSLRALARKIEVSAPFLSDLERGRRSTDKIEELAQALDVEPEELSRFDARISPGLKKWIESKPGLSQLLKEMKASGRTVPELREAFRGKGSTDEQG